MSNNTSTIDSREFFKILNKRVNQYFKTNNKKKQANTEMRIKTIFMISIYFIPFILLFVPVYNEWLKLILWTIMGFGMAGIGFSVMHDANHSSYSKNQKTNKYLGYLLDSLGGYHLNWKIQHNILHHTFTNIDGHDHDIESALLRLSPEQKKSKKYRFQLFYAPFLYSLMTVYWITGKDFVDIKNYSKLGLLKSQKITYKKAINQLIISKTLYYAFTLGLPFLLSPTPWLITLLGFLIMHFICGLTLALVFQTAHVVNETSFSPNDEKKSAIDKWATHQLSTTANFSRNSRIFSWYIGGLNYQIEHHLFPSICHIHYKNIAPIVQETAQEFGLPYHQHKSFYHALRSHFSLLNKLGKGVI